MKKQYLRDERGVAMLLELVLVAAVLSLAGLALYQTAHHDTGTVALTLAPPPTTTKLADTAAATVAQDASNEAALSATAEDSVQQLADSDSDITNLGGSFDVSAF